MRLPRDSHPPGDDLFSFSECELLQGSDHGDKFKEARPFPHLIIEGFLPQDVALQLLREFPPFEQMCREDDSSIRSLKYRSNDQTGLGNLTSHVLRCLNSSAFIHSLEVLSGLEGLVADPDIESSLRHFRRGGRLAVHVDGNYHSTLGLRRRLNLILYLNDGWKSEWGGALELWDWETRSRVTEIFPFFNRCVIFAPGERTLHGFPDPLQCPEEVTRKSLQLYYYTSEPLEASAHGTLLPDDFS